MVDSDWVLYKVVIDGGVPQMMVGRSLVDIASACNEWAGVINSAEFVMDIHYITLDAAKHALK